MAKKSKQKKTTAERKDVPTDFTMNPKTPTAAEVSQPYFERAEHFKPLHTIGMSAEAVEQALSGDKSMAAARMMEAAKSIEQRAKQVDQFRTDIGNDDRLDATTRFMERTKVQAQAVEALEKQINTTGQIVTEFVNDMGIKMQEAWSESGPEIPMNAAEIRAHISRLEPDKRASFVTTAIEAADGGVVKAALSAPAYMLGIEAHDFERLTTEAHKRFCPDAFEHRGQLLKALDVFTQQSKAVVGAYSIDPSDAAHYDRTQKAINDAQQRASALAGATA